MTVKHNVLDQHEKIAWDCDGTLYQGKNSQAFADYIKAHPEKQHYIITFRDYNWAKECIPDLIDMGLKDCHFVSVHHCPDDVWMNSQEGSFSQRWDFLCWKAKMAIELGCTILVDDMEDAVIHGCTEHGVAFLHAHSSFE